MSEINLQLKKLNGNREGLKEYLKNLDIDEITSFLNENIHLANGIQLLNSILLGFGEGLSSQRKKCETILFVLKIIDERDMSDKQCQIIMDQLNSHYMEMDADLLLNIIDYCIQGIQSGKVSSKSWKDTFPNVLNTLIEHNDITYNDQEMSGNEFKKQIINTLCMINWLPNIATKLASMFRSIAFSQDEHVQIISKLCQTMEKLTTQEIPPFTFQLLKLCETHNMKYLFLKLQNYFSKRITDLDKCKSTQIQKQNNMDSDLNEITCSSDKDALEAISTVLFHIDTFANNVFPGIKEYLNFLRVNKTAPEFVLHPFQLTILLIISSNSQYNDIAFEIIRQCVSRIFHEEDKRNNSAWFQQVTPVPVKVENIFTYLVENDLSERNLIIEGLVNFAFVLLDFKVGLGMKVLAEKHWQLGNIILLKLIKNKRDTANHIIEELCSFIIKKQSVTQYIDCLHNMSRNLKLIMLENQIIIINLIENLLLVPGYIADAIIDAIMPLIKISTTIRDNLILILRKALWCRTVETRQMAVIGFLKLLKSLKVSNLAAYSNSQGNISNRSIFSQLTAECRRETSSKVNNEALCLEVLDILRHCLMQQAEVRIQFYEGLYEAVCQNSELGIPVLDLLWNHFNGYYILEEEKLPPIDFEKIMTNKNADVILQEPIGHLIFTLSLTVLRVKQTNNIDSDRVEQCELLLNSLIERMSRCELVHFELDDGTDLTDILPESQSKLLTLKQAIGVFEALMGYLISGWNEKEKNVGKKVNNLFQAHSRLVDFLKNIHRPKKVEGKKKNKDKDETEPNKTLKAKTTVKNQIIHLLDFPVITKMLQLLLENNVSWATTTDSNVIKIKREFHRYILNVALQLVQNLKTIKSTELKYTDSYFNHCVEISTILYQRVIQRLEYAIDFDFPACALAVELFYNILTFVTSFYKEKFEIFLKSVMLNDDAIEIGTLLSSFIEVYVKLVQMDETDAISGDTDGKKIPILLVNTFSLLVMSLPKNKPEGVKVLDWLQNYLNDNVISNKHITNLLVPFWFNLHLKYKVEDLPFENVAIRLCDVIGTVNSEIKPDCQMELKSIDEGSVLNTLLTLTNTIKSLLDECDWLINRYRSEYTILSLPCEDRVGEKREFLKEKERDLCVHVGKIIEVCKVLANVGVPNGTYTEAIMKILVHLYVTLSNLTKYFFIISSKANPAFQSARFELVVKLSGKQLNNVIADFILSIEQNQQDADTQSKKKVDGNVLKSKVLKDTRLIPKLACEIEKYGKNIIQLSNKTKVDLNKYVGPGTSRDFRLKAPDLKAALEANKSGNEEDSFATADENESMENMEESVQEEETNDEVMEVDDSDMFKENDDSPPAKKAKK